MCGAKYKGGTGAGICWTGPIRTKPETNPAHWQVSIETAEILKFTEKSKLAYAQALGHRSDFLPKTECAHFAINDEGVTQDQ